ncbi:poly(A) polymerase catalytic subunit [Squirrelpox virus]|uniref:Poly(A) polymerase catalytic subunit n=1 Tax=Squirrelpox virus TaxID=240426 RepID=Q1HTS9_9POXV|nr:poly(A) polymerase catalytic subunit [Squirrelpox virus]ABD51457.1 A15L [Squirrelpox virus]CCD83206.1 poly(A) polymerase catalytic subunit [Squirrelpox virus]
MSSRTNSVALYLDRTPDLETSTVLNSQLRSILRIMRFNKDLFISLVRKNKRRFFKTTEGSHAKITERVNAYFSKQTRETRIGNLLAIIEFQDLLVRTYTNTIGVLTTPAPAVYSSQVRLNFASMTRLAEEALASYDLAEPVGRVMGRHNVSDLVEHVNRLMEEYLRRHNKSCLCYGSYSLHLLNPDLKYGDIDILQTNSRTFMINLAFLIHFVTGRNAVLIKVPYLKNYTVMQDEEGKHIVDSFNVRQDTISQVPKILVDNIYIVNPALQLMAMLKMMSQIDRLEDLRNNRARFCQRMATLLEFVRYNDNVDFGGRDEDPRMPLPCTIDVDARVVTADTSRYDFGFSRCQVYLDETVLCSEILNLGADESVVDFESVSNSAFLVHDGTLYTYFSNTVLMQSPTEVHEISRRAISAHVVMYLMLTGADAAAPLADMLNSLVSRSRAPIHSVIERDKKSGRHRVIDIARDII